MRVLKKSSPSVLPIYCRRH